MRNIWPVFLLSALNIGREHQEKGIVHLVEVFTDGCLWIIGLKNTLQQVCSALHMGASLLILLGSCVQDAGAQAPQLSGPVSICSGFDLRRQVLEEGVVQQGAAGSYQFFKFFVGLGGFQAGQQLLPRDGFPQTHRGIHFSHSRAPFTAHFCQQGTQSKQGLSYLRLPIRLGSLG